MEQFEDQGPTFSSMLAQEFVDSRVKRRTLGGAFVRLSDRILISAFLFEQGGILGRRFQKTQVPFITAYYSGAPRARDGLVYMRRSASQETGPVVARVSSVTELVTAFEMSSRGEAGVWGEWLTRRSTEKIPVDAALMTAWGFSIRGAALGLIRPKAFESLFHRSYVRRDPAEWKRAFKAGVAGTLEQPVVTLEEREREATAAFRDFCAEHFPELMADLAFRDSEAGHNSHPQNRPLDATDGPSAAAVFCIECGTRNEQRGKFCIECGTRFQQRSS